MGLMQSDLKAGMGNPNGFKCPTHGVLLVDIRGSGHVHGGQDHGYYVTACPELMWTGKGKSGFKRAHKYERVVNVPCTEQDENRLFSAAAEKQMADEAYAFLGIGRDDSGLPSESIAALGDTKSAS